MIDLDAIEARAQAATAGVWEGHFIDFDESSYVVLRVSEHDDDEGEDIAEGVYTAANAQFIAHARQDVPALVAEVRRLLADAQAEEAQR